MLGLNRLDAADRLSQLLRDILKFVYSDLCNYADVHAVELQININTKTGYINRFKNNNVFSILKIESSWQTAKLANNLRMIYLQAIFQSTLNT